MVKFVDLKPVIIRCCKTISKNSSDISDRFGFEIDIKALESALTTMNNVEHTNYHVMAFGDTVGSYLPNLSDIQLLVEYLHNKRDFDAIFNGKTEIAMFMLYSTTGLPDIEKDTKDAKHANDENHPAATAKEVKFNFTKRSTDPNSEDTVYSSEELYNILNAREMDDSQIETLKQVISSVPIYMVLVYKIFNSKRDKYEYIINFRSSYRMVGYHRFLEAHETK